MRPISGYDPIDTLQSMEGTREMYEPLRLSGTDHLVADRIQELHQVASEIHTAPRLPDAHLNLVERTRSLIGRRLMSLGDAVAGQRA